MQTLLAALLIAAGAAAPDVGTPLAPMPPVKSDEVVQPYYECDCPQCVAYREHALLRHPVPLPPRAAYTSPDLHAMWCRFYFRPAFNYSRQFDFPWRRPPYRHPLCVRCR